MNISLPQAQREYVEARVASGGYRSASEYIAELIRRDQREAGREPGVVNAPSRILRHPRAERDIEEQIDHYLLVERVPEVAARFVEGSSDTTRSGRRPR